MRGKRQEAGRELGTARQWLDVLENVLPSFALLFEAQTALSSFFSFISSLCQSWVFSVCFTESMEATVTAAEAHEMEGLKRWSLGERSDREEGWLRGQREAGTPGSSGLLVTSLCHGIPAMLTSLTVILSIQANLDLKPVSYKSGCWNVLLEIIADIVFQRSCPSLVTLHTTLSNY